MYDSDLFHGLPARTYDMVLFNPPLYDSEPVSELDKYTFCDPEGKTLARFLKELPTRLTKQGVAYLVVANFTECSALRTYAAESVLCGVEFFESGEIRAVLRIGSREE